MNLDWITELYIPIVLVACLVVGFICKRWLKDADHKWIPTIVTVLGAILACIHNHGVDLDIIVAGAVTGLASTGLHQLFTQLIEGDNSTATPETENENLNNEE